MINMSARREEITYKELLEAAEFFEDDPKVGNEEWILARKFVEKKNLYEVPTEEIKFRIIGFLNDWHCRLPVSDELAKSIKEAYRKSMPFLSALNNETLENFDHEKKDSIDGKEHTKEEILHQIFESFCKVGYHFRGVAASKVLSLINPHLFVMWDITICAKYEIRSPSDPNVRDKQYVPDFISVMKKKANDVIDSYMKDKKCTREEAVKAINNFREWRPLAKLLDEYNWMRYYKGIEI